MAKKNSSDFIDFKSLFSQYLSKWYLFVISVIVCVGLAYLFTKVRTPKYLVRANVLISTQSDPMMEAMGGLSDLFGSNGYVEDEIFIISSHSVYRDVAKDLHLNISHWVKKPVWGYKMAYPDYPVDVIPAAGIMDTLTNAATFKIKVNENGKADIQVKMEKNTVAKAKNVVLPHTIQTPLGDFTVLTTPAYPAGESVKTIVNVCGYNLAAEGLDEDVHNEIASKRSNVIALSIETPVPEYGENILNQIIAKYNAKGIQQKNNQGELTANFLDERLGLLAADLAATEANIQRYKQEHGIVDVTAEATYQTKKRGQLDESLLEAQTQAAVLRLIAEFLANPDNKYSLVPANVDNEGLQRAINDYNNELVYMMNLENATTGPNPQLEIVRRSIDLRRQNLTESMQSAVRNADVAVNEVTARMEEAQARLGQIPLEEREYIEMYRQQNVKSQLYYFLLRRSEENAMLLANAIPKGQIVDEAYTMSEPLGMKKKMILALAFILGLFITPVWLYVRKLFHNRFETRADVENITDVPILGEMCIDKSGKQLVVNAEDTGSTTELFRLMRSNLLFVISDPRDKVVLMTSTSSGEGKSFISINLAASLALMNKRVLLVGMDIRNPQLGNYLHVAPRYGLTHYLSSSDIKLNDIIMPLKEAPGLDVICAGPVPPNPAELLMSKKVDELFAELRRMYDYIIVDTAPIGLVSDTFTLDRIADATIYVCRANFTSLSDLTLINDIFEQHRLKKVSLVINGTAAKKTYGYGNKK